MGYGVKFISEVILAGTGTQKAPLGVKKIENWYAATSDIKHWVSQVAKFILGVISAVTPI